MDWSQLKPRAEHMFTKEAFYHVIAVLALLVAFWALYREAHQPLGALPFTSTTQNVPATGEQGFPVAAFCQDSATIVTKDFITPPDSTFVATYNLDRTKNGVHEVVTVGVYADPNKQPSATHYGPDNTPSDAYVSKDALKCIQDKIK